MRLGQHNLGQKQKRSTHRSPNSISARSNFSLQSPLLPAWQRPLRRIGDVQGKPQFAGASHAVADDVSDVISADTVGSRLKTVRV